MSAGEHSIANGPNAALEPALALVAISLSAGGLSPLRTIVRGLSAKVRAAVVVAQHVHQGSLLPEILATDTTLPVVLARGDMPLTSGTIYVCPAQQHVIINPDATLTLSTKGHVNFFRPSGDWLFESAAASFRERAFAIVLSGRLNDGARGIQTVRRAGGTVIAQRLDTCDHQGMPSAAIATGAVNFVLKPGRIPVVLRQLLGAMDLTQCLLEWNAPFTHERSAPGFAATAR